MKFSLTIAKPDLAKANEKYHSTQDLDVLSLFLLTFILVFWMYYLEIIKWCSVIPYEKYCVKFNFYIWTH